MSEFEFSLHAGTIACPCRRGSRLNGDNDILIS
jgi:hypothetical protein